MANASSGKYIWFNQGFTGWPLEFGRLLTNIFFSPYYSALLGVEQAWTPILYLTDFLCKSLALPRDLSTYLVIISFEPSLVEVNQGIKAWSF